MTRITFTGDGLAGTIGDTPDQQVKLCFPQPGQDVPLLPEADADAMRWYQAYLAIPGEQRPIMRSYTIRGWDHDTIHIDFVLHDDAGPATRWALSAAPGDVLGRVGPSAIYSRPLAQADWYLFAGDETALPAIGTLIESLPAGTLAIAYIEVRDAAEEQLLGEADVHWVPRNRGSSLPDAVREADFPAGDGFAWLAGEAGKVRAIRGHLLAERGIPKRSIEFTGYWRLRLTQDDAPTEEDLAEARERLAELSGEHAG